MTSDTSKNSTNPTKATMLASKDSRPYTVILYGATSFVGQITAHYLAKFLHDKPTQWAIAGRNADKLEGLKNELSKAGNTNKSEGLSMPATIIANSDDAASLSTMCEQGQVVISTVGPYLQYGEPLVKACTENGTDYVDLTGESIFIKDMMDKYQDIAEQSGARIVNSCGFDSIPSDLGVYFTQQAARERFDAVCPEINMRVKAAKGGLSGGTVASMATIFAEVGQDKARRKQLANPYLLNDDNDAPNVRQTSHAKPTFDAKQERWLAPFIMDSINTRIVHRSNQLLDYAYSRDFKYDEAIWMPAGLKGRAMSYALTAGIGGFAVAMSFANSRELLSEHVLPKSGDGPTPDEQENGYFDIRFFGTTATGQEIITKVTGDKDPGYGSTSQMLAQAALCLVEDIDKAAVGGGFWTPASAMGEALLTRLTQHAGLAFAVITD